RQMCIRDRFKFIRYPHGDGGPDRHPPELYDLRDDPGETRNLAADPAVIDALRLVRLPYHLSALTQAAAEGALAHAELMLSMVNDIRGQRDRIVAELGRMGFTPYPSQANFVLFGNVADPQRVFEQLLAQGIIIRDVGIPHHLRVTAGTETETSEFLGAIAALAPR
ncbi:MAG: aminotransferase class I/II-fold pyridoxal phosphate-dependent enzyme, partial [Microbacteriaceae bacterium]|nr:aminotransferase class I/II-fold pyridoxal phosphate-dependent enzyme [Microbacteriaceae bacterium]